jgi:hypothetical protein
MEFPEIIQSLETVLAVAKTMWQDPHPRLASKTSFVDGLFRESVEDKEKRELFNKHVKDLQALKELGFIYVGVCFEDGNLVSASFYKKAEKGGYLFENGSLHLTCKGMGKFDNGIVSAEPGEWVIAEFQDGSTDPKILNEFHEVDGWQFCIH